MVVNNHVVNVETEDAKVLAVLSHLVPSSSGTYTVGIAWRGSLCYTDNMSVNGGTNNGKGFRSSINSWTFSDLGLARVRHNFHNEFEY